MSKEQPEALRLADEISPVRAPYCGAAAAELRRLAAVEQELEALKRDISEAEPVDFIVSVVVIKSTETGFNTQNKLYPVAAVSREEAHGKALSLAGSDFPEHYLHTICSHPAQQAKPQPLTDEQITAGAKALCKRSSEICGVNADDNWNLESEYFKDDARCVLEAAHNIGEKK